MLAAMFPGQGSQTPGMGKDLFETYSEARDVFASVRKGSGIDPERLCFELEEDELRQTQNAQLALYAVGVAAYRCLEARLGEGHEFTAMAGHSVGEYAALACSGALSVEEGARLVKIRGDLMAEAGIQRPGTMRAVLGLDRDPLAALCEAVSSEGAAVVIANDNAPGQQVISGSAEGVERAAERAQEVGAKRIVEIKVSGAFHSPLMDEAAAEMGKVLRTAKFQAAPGDPKVYANVTSSVVDLPGAWPRLLETQLRSAVRWRESVLNMARDGVRTLVEFGPRNVLCGLVKRIAPALATCSVADSESLERTLEALSRSEVTA
ncbi:MAG TPA: ACP S-malonyltransferase [Fimbriimonadaceae bacterium]|nr:ACP S-malonyltransferase [Fimbriimonadaceae bacterium]